MYNYRSVFCFFLIVIYCTTCYSNASAQRVNHTIVSPDKRLEVIVSFFENKASYSVHYNQKEILLSSALGVVRQDDSFTNNLTLKPVKPAKIVTDIYTSLNAKRSTMNYRATEKAFNFINASGKQMDIIFKVSDDGIGFRYFFPEKSNDVKTITKELTAFHFPDTAKAWIQPLAIPKSGWEHTNPSYEENYLQGVSVGTTSPLKNGWVYPALFRSNNTWVLITEAALDNTFCGSRIDNDSQSSNYRISYPGDVEAFTGKTVLPKSTLPWYTPWRIITVGSLKTIVESTLGTDLASPSVLKNAGFAQPGKASWSWINSKDDYIIFSEQKKYIDFAKDMHWQYCLVDADWDRKIGYDSMKLLADYAKQQNVGLLLWYNSSGDWNTVKYSPKSKLVNAQVRDAEFKRLKEMGIKGVKIDFFGGDGQSMIQYYHDILKDAARYQLLVNFHGATLPRGWHRTYPHLLTTEAVKGFEMVTFDQKAADEQANHSAMLPFTRNVFDPMDFTPMNLYKINTRVKRKTTSAFELATSVVFLSGIQHFAESPEGMSHVPEFAKNFLRQLPVSWDEVKYLGGFPGKDFIVARRSGNKWYVAGINGETTSKTFDIDLSFIANKKGQLIADTEGEALLTASDIIAQKNLKISVKANGGFVAVF